MSDLVFPASMNGYMWDSKKKPVFNNLTHSPTTGRDIHISLYNQPVYEFNLSNQWLTKADKDSLIGFFLARQGSFDSFLYLDEDSVAVAEPIAVGNGVTTSFQLTKVTGGFSSIVNNPVGLSLYLNGALLILGTHYTISATGLISCSVPSGQVLSWSGSAYYRCVFLADSLEYNQFAERLYDCSEITFKGALVNKL